MIDDGLPSTTTEAQNDLEKQIHQLYETILTEDGQIAGDKALNLRREQHRHYLLGGLGALPSSAYGSLHSLLAFVSEILLLWHLSALKIFLILFLWPLNISLMAVAFLFPFGWW